MSNNLRQDEIKFILETGDFEKFIGSIEDEQLEYKATPYHLKNDLQKQELAKDVSALANADGGIILIGVRTERNPAHFGDEIKEICPFPQTLINPNQYHDILRSWIYPALQRVDIRWFRSAVDRDKGIVAILIPNQETAMSPFLVTRTIDDKGKRIEVVFGYVERRRANATPMSVQELHSLIKDGLRFDLLNEQYENIQMTLQELLEEQSHKAELAYQQNLQDLLSLRIGEALAEVNLHTKPAFILAAIPAQSVEIPTLFKGRDADITRILEQPPELRPNGFDLNTGASSRIVRGRLRRAVSPEWRILDLWRDGTLIFVGPGDADSLCWGRHNIGSGSLRINPLVLIESIYLFVDLSRQVFNHTQPHTDEAEYRLQLVNMTVGGTPCGLIPGALGAFGTNIHHASDSHVTITGKNIDPEPGAVAFDLVAELYAWFGIEQDMIPYTEPRNDRLVISPELIRKAGM